MSKENKWTKLIERIKFLKDKKYYKNNVWSLAAWDSWAANGQAGGCDCCSANHHNATLENKRNSKGEKGKYTKYAWSNSLVKLCSECVSKIEDIIDYKFNTR